MRTATEADRNWRRFVLFRVLFNSRFYYPILAIFFLDLGLTAAQYTVLNFAWALAIVLTDVPAGVLADRIGRKPLVVAASICMVFEMTLLVVAPLHGGLTLFLFCIGNRILSGIAEGLASGADEALVFDSLAEQNRSNEWPRVLDQVMRWQSVGMMIAMLVGGAVYDPSLMNRLAALAGFAPHLTQSVTLRFPVLLNLVAALVAVVVVLGFREPAIHRATAGIAEEGQKETAANAWAFLLAAGRWIFQTPVAIFVLVGGLLLDSVTRLLMTFGSSYFRLLSLPEASFGVIGAVLAGIGILAAPLARRLVKTNSLPGNYALLFVVILGSLAGAGLLWPYWGVVFMLPLGLAMSALQFQMSYYLNKLVDAHRRATVLSFKGLAINLGYGFVGLLFAGALKAFQDNKRPDAALVDGIRLLPLWLLFTVVLFALAFWSRRRQLAAVR
jgi:MFS family permease